MSNAGNRESTTKDSLETRKLLLETRLIERQMSAPGILMAWLQVASVPVALLGAILAFFVGFGQLRQGADNLAAERFDKALSRLASARPDERMTGVSGLQLFLSDTNPLLQKQALEFLINGLSMEMDARVRGAILDVLADLPPGHPSQAILNEGLRTAIERNRSLTRSLVSKRYRHVLEQEKRILEKFKIPNLDISTIDERIPAQVLAALTLDQYLAILDAEGGGPFENLEAQDEAPLIGLRTAVETLVGLGATNNDFSGIYCEGCNFSGARSLENALFESAYLKGAVFAHLRLRGASFEGADIGGADFFDADLTNANLQIGLFPPIDLASKRYFEQLPILECAKLKGADLSGQPLALVVKGFTTTSSMQTNYFALMPRMTSVDLDASTKLGNIGILIAIEVSDDYLEKHLQSVELDPLIKERGTEWENPFEESKLGQPDFRRVHGTSAKEPAKHTRTIAMFYWSIDTDDLKHFGGDAFMLRGVLEQPKLKLLPLYSQLVDAVRTLNAPETDLGKPRHAWSKDPAETWATMKPIACNENVRLLDLLVPFGSDQSFGESVFPFGESAFP